MSFLISSGASTGTVTSTPATVTTPTIANISMPLANTEYSYTLPGSTKRFMIKSRKGAKIQFAFTAGTTGTTYLTFPAGTAYSVGEISVAAAVTLYFQSATSGDVMEVESWV